MGLGSGIGVAVGSGVGVAVGSGVGVAVGMAVGAGVGMGVGVGIGTGVAVASSIIASTVGGDASCPAAVVAVGSSSSPHATKSIANMAASASRPKARFMM